ncbi:MAG: hypothetical protein COA71_07575 [SAR86 cluster bacterium]|uniref:Helix-hairpin-helix domain-containing protein n=1 Tax=SAR86 cluster bacterium TaxID=2030880 RepID=A0A2A5CD23_9GAMM|nr:MAG: hypothetical protein COA71_07575 [SAR86 cluster bacterium]
MKGITNSIKKEIKSRFSFLQLAFFALLLLGSYTSLAQSSSDNQDRVDYLNSEINEQVNINLADAETIALVLDGVGLSKAEAIVDYRESNGDFKAIDDLIMVVGIGEVTLSKNVDKILLVSD